MRYTGIYLKFVLNVILLQILFSDNPDFFRKQLIVLNADQHDRCFESIKILSGYQCTMRSSSTFDQRTRIDETGFFIANLTSSLNGICGFTCKLDYVFGTSTIANTVNTPSAGYCISKLFLSSFQDFV